MGARKLVAVAVAAVVVLMTARYLFWNDKRDIRRRLDAIAAAAGPSAGETPAERTARAAQLGAFVTDDVIIRTDAATFVGGRPAVVRFVLDGAGPEGSAIEGSAAGGPMTLSLADVQVERIDATTAAAFLTLNIASGNPRVPDPAPRQVHATLSKVGGEWLLSRGELLRTLK